MNGLKFLSYLSNLTHLDIANNNIEDEGLKTLQKFENSLIFLNIRNNGIGNKNLSCLRPFSRHLSHLNLSDNKITTEGLFELSKSKLNFLDTLNLLENDIDYELASMITNSLALSKVNPKSIRNIKSLKKQISEII